jgi:hypothetical protein
MTSEAGAVMTRALNGPDASPRRVLTGKAKRLRITAHARGHPPLRNDPTTRCRNNRKRVLVAVPVDPDHVVPLVCKHPPLIPRLVGSGGRRSEHNGNRAAGL